jgi:hypothetical protein
MADMAGKRGLRLVLLASFLLIGRPLGAGGPFQFNSVTPCRLVDTRNAAGIFGGPALLNGSARNFPVNSNCGIPLGAQAVTMNVTMITPTANGFLRIWPYNTTEPTVSNVNGPVGVAAIANGAIVPLTLGMFNVSVKYGTPTAGATCHVVIDVTGCQVASENPPLFAVDFPPLSLS